MSSDTSPGFTVSRLGITLRTALLAWLIALITLTVFVLSVVPRQKQTFIENLRSKAYGSAVSLGEIAATAVVNEDYSSVVDYCMEMLKRDPAVDYIVITRNDGFSLVHDRSSWETRNLTGRWVPATRVAFGGIEKTPVFDRRVYAYSHPFSYSGIEWGWIHVGLKLDAYDQSIAELYRRTALVAAFCLVFSLVASFLYARHIVSPVLKLQGVVRRVASGDLSARATVDRTDEIGELARSVNAMTEAILVRDRTLQETNLRLEERVEERTRELRAQKEAAERAHAELIETQRRLFEASRMAGMAQVATGILHNVGNVLNSVNISTNILRDELSSNAHLTLLQRTADLLRDQGDAAPRFIGEDSRGRHIPELIVEIGQGVSQCRANLGRELASLAENVDHIKQIVAVQQSYAKAGGLLQTFDPADLFNDAVRVAHASLHRHHVQIHTDFAAERPSIQTDRHLALQILVNLVQNAIAAVKVRQRDDRHITLQLRVEGQKLQFVVADNGVGIAPEDRQRLFQHGFTTRKDGHGFGLHSGALAATNLGGALSVASDGLDRGAIFTLELPVTNPALPVA